MKRNLFVLLLAILFVVCMAFVGCQPDEPDIPNPPQDPTYTVTFVGGESATGTAPSVSAKKAGETFELPANTFTKEGYVFTKWNDGSASFNVGATYVMPAKNVTFTAQWQQEAPKYTVTFALGDHPASDAVAPSPIADKQSGEKINLPSAIKGAEGYSFAGWSNGVQTYQEGASVIVTSSVTFTAVWKVREDLDDYKIANGQFASLSASEIKSASSSALAVNKVEEFVYGTLEIDVTIPSSVTTGDHGIVFALTEGTSNTYWEGGGSSYYFFFIDQNGNARLGKTGTSSTGTPTWANCGEKPIAGFTRGTVHTLKVEYNGERIKCYVDDVLYINFVDADGLTGTKFGFRAGLAEIVYSNVNCQSTDVPPDMGDVPDDQIPDDALIRDYQTVNGKFSYADGDAVVSTSGNSLAISKTGEYERGILEIDVYIPANVTTGDHGIVFSLTKASTETFWESGASYYFFFIDSGNNARLGKVASNPAWANCAQAPIPGFTRGSWHTLKIEKDDSLILCYVDDVLYLTYGDSSPLTGSSYGFRAGGENVSYKNVKVQNAEGTLGDPIQGFDTISGGFAMVGENIRSTAINSVALSQTEQSTGTVSVKTSIPTGGWTGIAFGADSTGSSYYRYLVKSDLSVALEKVTNGVATTLKTTSLVAKYSAGSAVTLKVIYTAEQIYTYIDDVCLVAWTAEVSGSRVGIVASSSNMYYQGFALDANTTPVQADLILWGHSHMQLWSNYKADLADYGTVVNMGIGGSNTPYWAKLIDEICSYGASKMIVMTGSNDIPYTNATDIMDMEEDIYAELLRRNPDLQIYLITEFLQPCRLDYADRVRQLNALYFLYEGNNSFVTVIDAYDIVLNDDDTLNQSMFIDIYHLTRAGYDILAGRVCDALDGNADTSVLDKYDVISGTFDVSQDQLVSSSANSLAILKNIGYNRIYVEMQKTGVADEYSGIVFGYDADGYYYFVTNGANAQLYKVSGANAQLVKEQSGAYNASCVLSVKFADGEIVCSVDEIEVISYTDDAPLAGNQFGVIALEEGVTFGTLYADEVLGKYSFNVGDESSWEITTNDEGNTVYRSLVKNTLLMFNDILFAGGTVEFDMTVNAQPADHFFNVVNGVIFGATRLDLTHDLGNWYCFGRWPGDGQMVVFSKNNDLSSGQFLWENSNKYSANIAVGVKTHYKFVWDNVNNKVHIWADGVEKTVQPLSRDFNGQYVGIYCDSANTIIENLTFTEESFENPPVDQPTTGALTEAQKQELFNFTVNTSDKWNIVKNEDDTYTYTATEGNAILMFKDKTFTGGTIEFDMTVNAEQADHTFQIVNGIIFGATRLDLTHDLGNWYCFGRYPGFGKMVGFSKNNDLATNQFLWENVNEYVANIAVGVKTHYKFVWDNENNKVYIWANGGIMAVASLQRDFDGQYVGIYCDSANTVIENLTFTDATTTFLTAEEKAQKYNFTVNTADNWVIEEDSQGNLTYHGITTTDSAMLMFKDVTFASGTVEFDMIIPTTATTFNCLTGIVFGASGLDCGHNTGSWYACGREQWTGFNTMMKDNGSFAWQDSNKFVGVQVGVKYHYKFVWDAEAGTVAYYLNGEYKNTQPLSKLFDGTFVGIYCETSGTQISNLTFTPAE